MAAIALGVAVGLVATVGREWSKLQPGQGAVIGGGAVLAAALLTFTSQHMTRNQEGRHHQEKETREREVALRERFSTSASQIADQSSAIRLAGVYAMASLARDWIEFGNKQEWLVCVSLLRAYLRVPMPEYTEDSHLLAERTVRETVMRQSAALVTDEVDRLVDKQVHEYFSERRIRSHRTS